MCLYQQIHFLAIFPTDKPVHLWYDIHKDIYAAE